MAALSEVPRWRIIPVVVVDDPADTVPLSEALYAGGLPVAEVTFRTVAAVQSIAAMAQNPSMLVGAGIIIHPDQVNAAAEAGARFLVPRLFEGGHPARPGDLPADHSQNCDGGELMAAVNEGITVVKFCRAGTSGEFAVIKAHSGPFQKMALIPTGDVGAGNLGEYLSTRAVAAAGGTWMVAPPLVAAGDSGCVMRFTYEAIDAVEATEAPPDGHEA